GDQFSHPGPGPTTRNADRGGRCPECGGARRSGFASPDHRLSRASAPLRRVRSKTALDTNRRFAALCLLGLLLSGWKRTMASVSDVIRQAAAIPLKAGQICLVTSSSGKRWVIPKGIIDPGKTAGEIALQEAWEEAGLVGVLQPQPVGSYRYEKY